MLAVYLPLGLILVVLSVSQEFSIGLIIAIAVLVSGTFSWTSLCFRCLCLRDLLRSKEMGGFQGGLEIVDFRV